VPSQTLAADARLVAPADGTPIGLQVTLAGITIACARNTAHARETGP
jgi:hypothetical protein